MIWRSCSTRSTLAMNNDDFLVLGLKIEKELDAREMEAELPAHDDSLEDRGLYLGSYAS